MKSPSDLTDLIHRAQKGDAQAVDLLFTTTYRELRRLARARLSAGGRDAILDTTSLVHESYLRFAEAGNVQLSDRVHFIRYAARAMRSVIIDSIRKRQAERRGGDTAEIALTTNIVQGAATGEAEILRIHDALDELAGLDSRMAQVVEMRYFAGMTEPEIAQTLGITERTVRRDWEKARLFLAEALK